LIIAVVVLQAGLALTFKVMFFGYYVVEKIGGDISFPGSDAPATNGTGALVERLGTLLF